MGIDLVPEVRERAAALPLARDRDRVPGRDERAQPGPPRPRPDRRAARGAPRRSSEKDARQRAGELLELVGIPQEARRGLPARAVGRDAPAGDDRDGPRAATRRSSSATSRRPRSTSWSRPRSSSCSRTCAPELGLSLILITHDLSVIAETCDRVLVMYAGRVAEEGPRRRGLPPAAPPVHPEAAGGVPEHPRRPADARGHPGLAAGPARPAAGLPVRAALLVRDGGLHARSCRPR